MAEIAFDSMDAEQLREAERIANAAGRQPLEAQLLIARLILAKVLDAAGLADYRVLYHDQAGRPVFGVFISDGVRLTTMAAATWDRLVAAHRDGRPILLVRALGTGGGKGGGGC